MLLSFRVENHRSLRDEQELLLLPSEQSEGGSPLPREITPLRVTGIFGANASGKSALVKALQFMRVSVLYGFGVGLGRPRPAFGAEDDDEDRIPREPFLLDGESSARTSGFAVELLLKGVRHSYGFTVDHAEIVEEWLHLQTGDGDDQVVFERDGLAFTYGDRDPDAPELTDLLNLSPNTLLITVLANANPSTFHSETVAALSRVRQWFSRSLRLLQGDVARGGPPVSRLPSSDPDRLERLALLAQAVDTGIRGYSVKANPLTEEERGEIEERFGKRRAPSYIRQRERGRVSFHHRGTGQDRPLDYADESSGTQALLALGAVMMSLLERGGTLVVDEIDTSLHTLLSGSLISLFKDPENNPRGAQLVFTSHDTSLLGRVHGREVLTEDEIWLTEKDAEGATSLFPMSSYESAGEENRDRRYLVGRYGAVPFVDEDLLIRALRPHTHARENDGSGEESPHEEGP
ncbi:ATP-binding protein [Nocardiopsis sp. NPDC007018]|uniref:AAA family ATPase n=1 Tax=Nocardiopsis sp. NPDC007018 TaxID=3155721 RepID=UPI0033C70720